MPQVAEYMAQALPKELLKVLHDRLKGLPETGVPAAADPEVDRIVEEEKKFLLTVDPALGATAYTYGLPPEVIAVKQKYAELWEGLKKWRDEGLARLKTRYLAEKEELEKKQFEAMTAVAEKVPPGPDQWEALIPVYEEYGAKLNAALDRYAEDREAVHQAYLTAFMKSLADYTDEFYTAMEKAGA